MGGSRKSDNAEFTVFRDTLREAYEERFGVTLPHGTGPMMLGSPFNPHGLGFDYFISTRNNASKKGAINWWHNGIFTTGPEEEASIQTAKYAIEWMRKQVEAEKPFLSVVWFHTPHVPVEATREFKQRYAHVEDKKQRTYVAMLTAMDQAIGDLRTALREMDIEEHTLIFFCSDNGGYVPGVLSRLEGLNGMVGSKKGCHQDSYPRSSNGPVSSRNHSFPVPRSVVMIYIRPF